ncbi:MAG: hypothetical protein D6739_12210 [Nitrospirae bacterium]|nr:MAG: hypothetical protein D6739_12210 [Nitrospirota bacterium]
MRVGGCAKGAGMIHPRMATLIAVVTTDAALEPEAADGLLRRVAGRTFNRISVDGDTSTNDTLYLLASGAAGAAEGADLARLEAAVEAVCGRLARALVADGEGATKVARIEVTGGRDAAQVERIAEAICRSALVKTALFGEDANWGRIVAAAGAAGAGLTPETTRLWLEELLLYDRGLPTGAGRSPEAAALMARPELGFRLDLGQGRAATTHWTCDLSYDYVRINAEYRT